MMPEVTTSPRSVLWERTVAVIKGAFCFFPGFLLSLPFTAIWARRQCPGEAQCVLIAIIPSFFIGVAFAIACMAWLLESVNSQIRAVKYLDSPRSRVDGSPRDSKPGRVSDSR
jgi:hypothetical protein